MQEADHTPALDSHGTTVIAPCALKDPYPYSCDPTVRARNYRKAVVSTRSCLKGRIFPSSCHRL